MCRHLAYVGPAVTLASLLYDPPHSLVRQSWAPGHQRHGTVNADGYGVGWYVPQVRTEPARYRRSGRIWATAWGDTLWTRVGRDRAVVASEPDDDGEDWLAVPDRTLVVATAGRCSLTPLAVTPGPPNGKDSARDATPR